MAAVEDLIEFRVCDFAIQPCAAIRRRRCFFNPEYGDRLGERSVCNLFINAWAIFSNNYGQRVISGIFYRKPGAGQTYRFKANQAARVF